MLNLVLFGPPGAGKGTQAKFLVDEYNLMHISTGELLRAEIAAETEWGKLAKETIDKGQLCPDNIVLEIIRKVISENLECDGFLFDGFPRTPVQASTLDEILGSYNIPLAGMLSLEVEHNELRKRLEHRGKSSGRSDDRGQDIIENRIQIYLKTTLPIIDYYKPQGKFHGIDGMGDIDEVTARLKEVVLSLNKKTVSKQG